MNISLTDQQILDGLKRHDETVTRRYFYDYCRIAYHIYNKKYGLAAKPGMDFYSLAHEYYLTLDNHQWRQMEDRKPGITLKTWMIGGFRFLILDRLKQTEHERMATDIERSSRERHIVFENADDSSFNSDVRKTVEEIANTYYGRDSTASIILKLLLVDGYKGKEVAAMLGMTPSAVSQRYNKMMKDTVIPYFKTYYTPVYRFFGDMQESQGLETYATKSMFSLSFFKKEPTSHRQAPNTRYMHRDISQRTTPEKITDLQPDEIFVFGSNLGGMHGGGAARTAFRLFGAVMGQGTGLQGRSYAIPTMQGGTNTIKPYVDEFIHFAKAHPELRFLVTRIGCGIAGFTPDEIAPLFADAVDVDNIALPRDFWDELL